MIEDDLAVLDALYELLSDISVPKATTKQDFREIKDQVNLILESLDESDDPVIVPKIKWIPK